MGTSNLVGAITAAAFLLSAMLVFICRLVGRPGAGKWIGLFEFALSIPLIYLLTRAPLEQRENLYILQIGVVLGWLLVEFLLDYVFRHEFRQTRWMVISYVILFFAACGGLVGIASHAGRAWTWVTGVLFLFTAALAFIQRRKTGL
jgi:hypothetical protein